MKKIRIIVYCPPEGTEVIHITNDLSKTASDIVCEYAEFISSDTLFETAHIPSDFPINRDFREC